jgi:hypothetical protein
MDRLAIIDEASGCLTVFDLDGKFQIEFETPTMRAGNPFKSRPGFWGCRFDRGGDCLWSAAPISDSQVQVQVRSIGDWSVVATAKVPNHFGDCYCGFEESGPPGVAALWLGCEGDTEAFWLQWSGTTIGCREGSGLAGPGPIEFSPAGDECLVYENAITTLLRIEFPGLRQVGRCGNLLDGVMIGSPLAFLNSSLALMLGYPGRLVLFDIRAMRALEEVVVEGHEPRTLRESTNWYTGGATRELHTDIKNLARIGANIVVVFDPDFHSSPLAVRHCVITFPVTDLLLE